MFYSEDYDPSSHKQQEVRDGQQSEEPYSIVLESPAEKSG